MLTKIKAVTTSGLQLYKEARFIFATASGVSICISRIFLTKLSIGKGIKIRYVSRGVAINFRAKTLLNSFKFNNLSSPIS